MSSEMDIKIFLPKNNYYFSPYLKYQDNRIEEDGCVEGAESVRMTFYIYQQK